MGRLAENVCRGIGATRSKTAPAHLAPAPASGRAIAPEIPDVAPVTSTWLDQTATDARPIIGDSILEEDARPADAEEVCLWFDMLWFIVGQSLLDLSRCLFC